MTSSRPYLLRAVYEWILDNGLTPYLLVNAGVPGVRVPPQSIRDGRVVLNLAPQAVGHLEIGNDEITLLARFSGASHQLTVPMAAAMAVYAQENGQGMMFSAEDGTAMGIGAAAADDPVHAATSAAPDAPPPDKPPRGTPHLRVIK